MTTTISTTATSPLSKPLEQSLNSFCRTVAERNEVTEETVRRIASWHKTQIRHMDNIERAAKVPTEILFVANEYGARAEIQDYTLKECCKLVIEKFGHLNLQEIREAYRCWASEEIHIEGAELYGGKFNVRQLGRVLAAYDKKRRRILAEIIQAKEKWQREQQEEKDRLAKKQAFEATFPASIEKVKQAKTWKEIPEFIYMVLRNRRLITITKTEALDILEKATRIAETEIEEEKRNRSTRFAYVSTVEDRATSIARKMTVFQKVTSDPAWELPEDWNQNQQP
jgi:hypothetical protein